MVGAADKSENGWLDGRSARSVRVAIEVQHRKSWGIGNLAHGAIMGDCVWRTRNPVHSVGHLPEGTAMETASHAEVHSRVH